MNLQTLTGELKRLEALIALASARGRAAIRGLALQNNGVPLAGGPFTTLNLQPGLTAANSGGGVAAVTAAGGGGFPLRVSQEHGPGGINHIHVPAAVAGTVAVVNGSTAITFSVAPGFHQGDLLFDGTTPPSTLPLVNELAADTVGVNGVLTAPWAHASNPALAMTTVPVTDAITVPPDLTPLPASGWRVEVRGAIGLHNTVAGAQTVAYYVAGLAAFGVAGGPPEGIVFDIPAGTNLHYLLPLSTDLVAPGPAAPVTYNARIFCWAFGGAPGDIEATTIPGSNSEIVTLVGTS